LALLLLSSLPLNASPLKAFRINIRNAIGNGLREYVSRGVRTAEEEGADLLIFDIHTPGGALNAAGDIIKTITDSELPSVAFVNDEAISAGALIALSCDLIAITPKGTIGDAQPIPTNPKTVSYVVGRIRSIAEMRGRSPDVAAAMVDKDLVLVRLKDGTVKALDPKAYEAMLDRGIGMEVISPQGNVLTLSAKRAVELGVADLIAEDLERLLRGIALVELKGERGVVTVEEAEAKGLAYTPLAGAEVRDVPLTIAERIAVFVTNPFIASLLLSIGILGLIIEFKTVGWGVAGTIGLLCLALFFGGHMIAKIDAGIGLLIFIVGVGLLLLEIFVIPGFGVAGISGIALIIAGLLFTLDTAAGRLSAAATTLAQAVIMMAVLGGLLIYILPKTSLWKSTVLQAEESVEGGYTAPPSELARLEGKRGVSLSPLRPSGVALIDGERVDVLTEGEFVEPNVEVEVVRVEGGKVVVRPVRGDEG